jgi:hypothetical protein
VFADLAVIYDSALAKVVGVFLLILVLARFKVPLAISIIVGSIVAGAVFGLGAWEIAITTIATIFKADTFGLLAITILLLGLSATMKAGGQMQRLVELTQALVRRPAAAMAALPAIIGLLPMPGGAIFSAPMVETAAGDHQLTGGQKSAVNYWFRHIWEHWWPLYPGVILATTFVPGANFATFAAMQLPLGIVMTLAGLLILFRMHPDTHRSGPAAGVGIKRQLVSATRPIWLIIAVWLPLTLAVNATPPALEAAGGLDKAAADALATNETWTALARFVPICLGLVVSIVVTTRVVGIGRHKVREIWTSKGTYSLVGLVFSVMLFQAMLIAVDAAAGIKADLDALGVPLVMVVALLPMIAGAVTGLAFGFVGTAFPIVLPLVSAGMPGEAIWPYAVLAYGFGHVGMMASPLHMCHIVSNRYFETGFGPVYRQIIPPSLVMLAGTVLYFVILQMTVNG